MKPIDEPRNARSRRTRQALLDAARQLIEADGFAATTLAAVADRAGVSHRALYLHFSSRGELLAALTRSLGETESLAESLAAVWDSPDAASGLDEWARHIARAHPRILAIGRAVEHDRHTDPDAAEIWQQMMGRWSLGARRLAEWLHRENQLAAPWTVDSAADMIWALMSWDFLERLTVDRGWAAADFAEHFSLLVRRTFLLQPE
jgi:AcrR family transcriptional regulator